jgi:hypothetical protein
MSGRCQIGIKRACWANGVASTQEAMKWAYPLGSATRELRKNRARAVVLAARRMAIRVGRRWPEGAVWRLKHGYGDE